MPFDPYKRPGSARRLVQPNIRPLRESLGAPRQPAEDLLGNRRLGRTNTPRWEAKRAFPFFGEPIDAAIGGARMPFAPTRSRARAGSKTLSGRPPRWQSPTVAPPTPTPRPIEPVVSRGGSPGRPDEEGYKWFYTSEGQWVKRPWPPRVQKGLGERERLDQRIRPNPRMLEFYQSQNPSASEAPPEVPGVPGIRGAKNYDVLSDVLTGRGGWLASPTGRGEPAGMASGTADRGRPGMATGDRREASGQAAGWEGPSNDVLDLIKGVAEQREEEERQNRQYETRDSADYSQWNQYMSWLGNTDQATQLLFDWFQANGVPLPQSPEFLAEYERIMDAGGEHRNQSLKDLVRGYMRQLKGEYNRQNQTDPTQTDPNTENIPGLEDRNMTPGTGFPWSPNLTDPGSQDAPAWVDAWQNQIADYMPQIADQYGAIANRGVYGEAGMETVRAPLQNATNKVLGSMEPWLNKTTAGIRQSEANQRRRALQATKAGMGRLGAQRPGAAAQSVATNITMPSMVAESDRIFGAHQDMKSLADRLVMGMGEFDTNLTRENMLSKAQIGLPGMAGTFGQMSSDLARRSWDKSMENKFGWSPERQGETQWRIMDYFRDKDFTINWNMGQQNALLNDWGQARSQQRQYEYASLLMELKQKYDKEMQELFGPDWFDKLMGGVGVGADAYGKTKGG